MKQHFDLLSVSKLETSSDLTSPRHTATGYLRPNAFDGEKQIINRRETERSDMVLLARLEVLRFLHLDDTRNHVLVARLSRWLQVRLWLRLHR